MPSTLPAAVKGPPDAGVASESLSLLATVIGDGMTAELKDSLEQFLSSERSLSALRDGVATQHDDAASTCMRIAQKVRGLAILPEEALGMIRALHEQQASDLRSREHAAALSAALVATCRAGRMLIGAFEVANREQGKPPTSWWWRYMWPAAAMQQPEKDWHRVADDLQRMRARTHAASDAASTLRCTLDTPSSSISRLATEVALYVGVPITHVRNCCVYALEEHAELLRRVSKNLRRMAAIDTEESGADT